MAFAPRLEIVPRTSLRIGPELSRAIGLLKLRNAELGADISRIAARNPFLRVRTGGVDAAETAAPAAGLYDHVIAQIGLLPLTRADRRIALVFVEHLEPSGWLAASPDEIAERTGCDITAAETVLRHLHDIEPAGLFARSLAECLELQARDRGWLSDDLRAVLGALDAMAEGGAAALATSCGLSPERTRAALATLRALDPKPGAQFAAADPALLRAPDLVAVRNGADWQVDLNPQSLPRIDVVACPAEAPKAVRQAAEQARSLAAMIARRNRTVLEVARAIVARQAAYLARKSDDPAPLRRADVALIAGVHETTVCRVAHGMTIETPRGVIALAVLFSRPLSGGDCSLAKLQSCIRSLIADEPAALPLSDATIAARLARDGIVVARRSIARHRMALGIPARSSRRHSPI